jgi:hypothetical protein
MLRLAVNAFVNIASTLVISALAFAAPVIVAPTTPNFYKLHGQGLEITYMISECTGTPYFKYQNSNQTLQFYGDQIRTIGTEIGIVATVTTILTVDNGWTTFSVLLPQATLGADNNPVPIETEGITTDHEFSPTPHQGQREFYTFSDLTGEAKFVPSLCG